MNYYTQHILEMISLISTGTYDPAYDLTADGVLSIQDLLFILQGIAG